MLERNARLVITGTAVAAIEVRAAVRTDRAELLGLVSAERLKQELEKAALGIVTQASEAGEFNVP